MWESKLYLRTISMVKLNSKSSCIKVGNEGLFTGESLFTPRSRM